MRRLLIAFYTVFLFSFPINAQPKYEFRGAWVATVDNIDWPSKGNFNADSQKVEYIRMLDMHQRNGINAVIVQVRPATDAFYPSPYEPWSEWLTGKQGVPPSPYYDPLQFMIEEAHKRGMEFHAWCNPYRAEFKIGQSSISPSHVTKLHPEWFLAYGGVRYFDPGNKEAQQFVVKVVRDIVSRYDVDAVHFDDYFYPYRITGQEFPDAVSYTKYGKGLNLEDWRRSNVDSVILMLSKAIKEEKRYCRFGISPFGVWRNMDKDPDGSATKAGQTNYDDLYANILLWLKQGWIDYVAPQLYWEFGHSHAPFEVLLDWWGRHTYGKQCYIGLGIYRAGSNPAWREKSQLPRMLQAMRNTPHINGAIYFSSKTFEKNPNGWSDSLRNNYYRVPALIPADIDSTASLPMAPSVKLLSSGSNTNSSIVEIIGLPGTQPVKQFVLYAFEEGDAAKEIKDPRNIYKIIPAINGTAQIDLSSLTDKKKIMVITAIDEENRESATTPVNR